MNPPAPDVVAVNVEALGTLLFCLVFLFLWRQSGIVYFGYWSLAWALQVVALSCLRVYFSERAGLLAGTLRFFRVCLCAGAAGGCATGPRGP